MIYVKIIETLGLVFLSVFISSHTFRLFRNKSNIRASASVGIVFFLLMFFSRIILAQENLSYLADLSFSAVWLATLIGGMFSGLMTYVAIGAFNSAGEVTNLSVYMIVLAISLVVGAVFKENYFNRKQAWSNRMIVFSSLVVALLHVVALSLLRNVLVFRVEEWMPVIISDVITVSLSGYYLKYFLKLDETITELELNKELLEISQRLGKIGSWKVDVKTHDVYWSKQMYDIFGVDSDDAVNLPATEVIKKYFVGDSKDKALGQLNFLSESATGLMDGTREYVAELDSGHKKVLWGESMVINPNSEKKQLIGFLQDVTSQKRVQEQLLKSAKLASLGELAAGVGHEINNPLTIIYSYLAKSQDVIGDNPLIGTPLAGYLYGIERSLDKISKIVKSLRYFSRIENEKMQRFIAETAINETINFSNELISQKNLKLVYLPEPKCFSVIEGEPAQLQQVIVNLINNAKHAVKHSENPEIQIRVQRVDDGKRLMIEVADNGQGVPKDIRDRIFDSFYTTKSSGEGTGLGLSISLSIIKKMNGDISIQQSEELGGARFVVMIPLQENVTDEEIQVLREKPLLTFRSELVDTVDELDEDGGDIEPVEPSEKPVALVVDDEPEIGSYVSTMLVAAGYELITCNRAKEAMEQLKHRKVDILFTDLNMPEMSGEQLVEQVVQHKIDLQHIIVMSGAVSDDSPVAPHGEYGGHISGYLDKPFTNVDLKNLLMSLEIKKSIVGGVTQKSVKKTKAQREGLF